MTSRHPMMLWLAAALAAAMLGGCAGEPSGEAGRAPETPAASTDGATDGATTAPEGASVATVRVGDLPPLRVEVADTDAERAQGLSGRERLPPGTGMIFRYDAPSTAAFWMHDVHFPLSLAWVRGGRVIGTVEMTPCTAADPAECRRYEPPAPFDTVIEAPGDTFAGVAPGTSVRVTFDRPAG